LIYDQYPSKCVLDIGGDVCALKAGVEVKGDFGLKKAHLNLFRHAF